MIEYSVENMSCGHCVATVTQALRDLNPTTAVRVELNAGRVWVGADIPPEEVLRALESAGYPATLVGSG